MMERMIMYSLKQILETCLAWVLYKCFHAGKSTQPIVHSAHSIIYSKSLEKYFFHLKNPKNPLPVAWHLEHA